MHINERKMKLEKLPHLNDDLKNFLLDANIECFEYSKDIENWYIDFLLGESDFTLYISDDPSEKIVLRFDFLDLDIAQSRFSGFFVGEEKVPLYDVIFKKVQEFSDFVDSTGWKYSYSHASLESAYAWADASFEPYEFSLETLIAIEEKVREIVSFSVEIEEKYPSKFNFK